jgi:hypothetical protein
VEWLGVARCVQCNVYRDDTFVQSVLRSFGITSVHGVVVRKHRIRPHPLRLVTSRKFDEVVKHFVCYVTRLDYALQPFLTARHSRIPISSFYENTKTQETLTHATTLTVPAFSLAVNSVHFFRSCSHLCVSVGGGGWFLFI